MKPALLVVFALAGWGQITRPVASAAPAPPPKPAPVIEKVHISRGIFSMLEDGLNQKLIVGTKTDPVYMMGRTRGVYLPGYGVVFTVDVDLIQSPTINLFQREITAQDKDNTYARKTKQLPVLRQTMRDMVATTARTLDMLPPNQQVVLAVRLWYQSWERTSGLPTQIMMRADRESAANGKIEVEEQ